MDGRTGKAIQYLEMKKKIGKTIAKRDRISIMKIIIKR